MNTRIFIKVVFVCLLAHSVNSGQNVEYTKRSKNEVREGPGNYFSLVYIFPPGIPVPIVRRESGWIYFQLGDDKPTKKDIQGWISKNCLIAKKPRNIFKEIEFDKLSLTASPSSAAAAIRGFALRYGKTNEADVDSLLKFQEVIFSPEEYKRFKNEMKTLAPELKRKISKLVESHCLEEYDITIDEEGVGLGIAARVAEKRLVNDQRLLKYLGLISAVLSEASGAYDVYFKVFVLRDQNVNAVSIPGGYVFLTEPIIEICEDESEIASIIAHEMMHIIMKHGVKEINQRIINIKMDEAMRELDDESGSKDLLDDELEEFALEAYDMIHKPRLLSYEEEADRGAVLLLANVGYDVDAVSRMVLKLQDATKDMDEDDPFVQADYQKRHKSIRKFIDEKLKGFKGNKYHERFLKNMRK